MVNHDWMLDAVSSIHIHTSAHSLLRSHPCSEEARVLTWSVPTKVHGFGGRSGGDPQGEEAHHHAAKVCQQVSGVSHDGQAVSQVSSCRTAENDSENDHLGASDHWRKQENLYILIKLEKIYLETNK